MSGNNEIYQILLEIKERIGNIDGKLEGLTNTIKEQGQKLSSLEQDVNNLKSWKKGVSILAGVVAFVISLLVTVISAILSR